MLGYDMSWASFNVVEVMSSARIPSQECRILGCRAVFQSGYRRFDADNKLIEKGEVTIYMITEKYTENC